MSGERDGSWRRSLRTLSSRKWQILLLGSAVTLAAVAVAYALPPTFRATATVAVEPARGPLSHDAQQAALRTEVQQIRSRDLALATIRGLKLWEQPEFDPRDSRTGWRWTARLALGVDRPATDWTDDKLAVAVLDKFNAARVVEPVAGSSLVRIAFESGSPVLAASAATRLAEAYVQRGRDDVCGGGASTCSALQQALAALRQKLDSLERRLQEQRQQPAAGTGSANPAAGPAQAALAQQLTQARLKRTELEAPYNAILQARKAGANDYSAIPAVMRHPLVAEARKQEEALAQKLAELSLRYGVQHPQVIQVTTELQAARQRTAAQAESVASTLLQDHDTARATEKQLEAEQSRARAPANEAGSSALAVLERALAADRQALEQVVARTEADSSRSAAGPAASRLPARVIETAGPGVQVRPRRGLIIGTALVLSLAVGTLLALALGPIRAAG